MKSLRLMCLLSVFLLQATGEARGCRDLSRYWRGCYGGVHGGYSWSSLNIRIGPISNPTLLANLVPRLLDLETKAFFGGVQMGYSFRCRDWVSGIETDLSVQKNIFGIFKQSPISGAFPGSVIRLKEKTYFFTTLRARIGYTMTFCFIIYATGGLASAYSHFKADTDFRPRGTNHFPIAFNTYNVGWTAGAGLEYAFHPCWSMKAEMLYYNVGRIRRDVNPTPASPPLRLHYRFENTKHFFRVGLNYKL